MSVTIHIPATLRAYCRNSTAEIVLSAETVRDALEQLKKSHPALHQSICDETGAVRRHVNLFINNSFARNREGLESALQPGDTLTIMPAASGG